MNPETSTTIRASTPAPWGAGASRLVFGTTSEHVELECAMASWLGLEEALLFSSGYAANVGTLGALLSPEDAVFSDALNHASLIDGIRLSRARPTIIPHLDHQKLEDALRGSQSAQARWVVVESYYSMDGDGPDLLRLRKLCERYDAHLYVDEAHSVGTFGPEGRGLCAATGILPDVLMVGFGKAMGLQGGMALGRAPLRTWLWNRARSFVFSTAPSPWLAATLYQQIDRVREKDDERARLVSLSERVRREWGEQGLPLVPNSFGPVVALPVGSEVDALELAARLRDEGILAQAIRPPTVPENQSRIRLVLRSSLSDEQCARLIDVVARETRRVLRLA